MKKITIIAITSAFALASSGLGIENSPLVDVAKLDGMKVFDTHGQQLGSIQQVLVDPKSGITRYGVVEVDKAWNWSDPEVAVPWSAFSVNKSGQKDMSLTLDATKEKLEKAPRYKKGDADRIYTQDAAKPIYSYWSIYWWDMPSHTQHGEASSPSTGTTDKGTSGTGTTSSSTNPTSNTRDSSAQPKK